jgi:RNA polymerase sigma factor (TIGR02999 family)
MAGSFLRDKRRGHTLQCTALVHEAYMRLAQLDRVRWQNRAQFFSIAAQVLRHILVDYARRRQAQKRGGGAAISLDEALAVPVPMNLDVEALDHALSKLAGVDEARPASSSSDTSPDSPWKKSPK